MKHIIAIFFSLSLVAIPSCDDLFSGGKDLVCEVENPLTDLEWLKDIKTAMEMNMGAAGAQIIQYTYGGEYVFAVDICYNCADNLIHVYDCQGNIVCQFGGIAGQNTCPDFEDNASGKVVLFDSVGS